jgi:VanZ family protein
VATSSIPVARPGPAVSVSALWALWIGFVVYGSLVPLEYVAIDFDTALARFSRLPMLALGVTERADWIANGVLYLPVGFLTTLLLARHAATLAGRVMAAALAIAFAVVLALGVEFTQLYFPQRTVSLNDVYAECIGGFAGAVLAAGWGHSLRRLAQAMAGRAHLKASHAGLLYLVLYVAYSLFPYDLLLTGQEVANKLASDLWGWVVADSVGARLRVLVGLSVVDTLTAVPLGLLFAHASRGRSPVAFAVFAGALLGVALEVTQFFIASGVSQGWSVAMRMLGCGIGAQLWRRRAQLDQAHLQGVLARAVPWLVLPYLLTLVMFSGWFSSRWIGLDEALGRLDGGVRFMPFYYHYFTSEAKAVFSLASVALMYVPIGIAAWARGWRLGPAMALGALVAALVETGKLFVFDSRPDPTNLLIAAGAVWLTVRMLRLAPGLMAAGRMAPANAAPARIAPHAPRTMAQAAPSERSYGPEAPAWPAPPHTAAAATSTVGTARAPAQAIDPSSGALPHAAEATSVAYAAPPATGPARLVAAGVGVALCLAWALQFPSLPWLLAAGLLGYAALVWQRPLLVFFVTPALLPMLDLAPFSGRTFLDEYDALLAVGLCVGFARLPPAQRRRPHHATLRLLALLMAGTLVISVARALLPWPGIDANSFLNDLSPFNALRIAKGGLWALLLLALATRQPHGWRVAAQLVGQGLVAGLAYTVLFVLWERRSFTNWLDFTNQYRVTGPFSAMHTGGAYVECFLVVATPFLVHAVAQARLLWARLAGGVLLLGTAYAVMVTFSRGGYVAFALALLLAMASALRADMAGRKAWIAAALMLAGVAAVALPILGGGFAQTRLAASGQDLSIREQHWAGALALHDGDWTRSLLGLGLGSFPAAHYWSSEEKSRSATYQLFAHDGKAGLRLGSGRPLYLDQLVDVQPYTNYRVRVNIRAPQGNGRVAIILCHKWMLESQDCRSLSFAPDKPAGQWSAVTQMLNSGPLGSDALDHRRPVKLSLYSTGAGTIELDDLRLEDARGRNLLRNGDFASGMDHWHFTADDHLAWHVKNLPLAWYVDQGIVGLGVLALWLVAALWKAGRGALRAEAPAGAVLAALVGFLAVGIFDALLDTPRFLMLLLVLSGFALALRRGGPHGGRARREAHPSAR